MSETELIIQVFQLLKEFYNYFKIISATMNKLEKYSRAAISLWKKFEIFLFYM